MTKTAHKTVYVYGFGVCYLAVSLKDTPAQGKHMRYCGSEDGYMVYGTDQQGINMYTDQSSVEFWAIAD